MLTGNIGDVTLHHTVTLILAFICVVNGWVKNVLMAADYRPGGTTPERGGVGLVCISQQFDRGVEEPLASTNFSCPAHWCQMHVLDLCGKLYFHF